MKKITNQLIQLQELIEAHTQQEAVSGRDRLEDLNRSIEAMTTALPPDVAGQFQRLRKKSHLAIVPLSNGVCTGCGMKVPVSQVHDVHAGTRLNPCPNCTRFLYQPESVPARRTLGSSPVGVSHAGISRFSHPDLMVTSLKAKDMEGVLLEMAQTMAAAGFVDNGSALAEAALRREAIMSTAVEHGIAFPHARGVEGGGLTLALGIHAKGVRFAPDSKELTRIIFFMAIPTAASAFYLRLLSGLTKTFGNAANRQALTGAKTPDALWKALKTTTRKVID